MSLKPLRLGLPTLHLPSQHNLKRPLPKPQRRLVDLSPDNLIGAIPKQPVKSVNLPVEFLLRRNHLATNPLPLTPRSVESRPSRHGISSHSHRSNPLQFIGQAIKSRRKLNRR